MILTPLSSFGQRLRLFAALSFAALSLTACAYHSAGNVGSGSSIDNPVERKFTWFSYLDAADIRNSCAAGGPDQYRLVYNGQYDHHVRTYEVTSAPTRQIVARARGTSGDITQMGFNSFDELLGPWNFRRSQTALSEADWTKLRDLLHESGFAAGSQAGLRLHSQDFYWLAAGCEGGKFFFNAWADKPRALSLTHTKFLDFLLRHDGTGLAYVPPRPVTYMDKNEQSKGTDRDYSGAFVITVHEDGIGRAGL
ncbi:hypothetical protein [Dongia sp.]|jgi:hypothetical protein|uniref:hypothetical protein n=1 Tax=Dongia sp. TaxID=1977262 RepID=UPI0035AFBE0A